jgi:hypothetical protein
MLSECGAQGEFNPAPLEPHHAIQTFRGFEMTRNHEKLLIAALAGVIIAGAAAFATLPAIAQPFGMKGPSQLVVPSNAVLTLRLAETV